MTSQVAYSVHSWGSKAPKVRGARSPLPFRASLRAKAHVWILRTRHRAGPGVCGTLSWGDEGFLGILGLNLFMCVLFFWGVVVHVKQRLSGRFTSKYLTDSKKCKWMWKIRGNMSVGETFWTVHPQTNHGVIDSFFFSKVFAFAKRNCFILIRRYKSEDMPKMYQHIHRRRSIACVCFYMSPSMLCQP